LSTETASVSPIPVNCCGEKTVDCWWLGLPLLDSILYDEIGIEAHLPGHSTDLGKVSSDGLKLSSGSSLRYDGEDREEDGELRGI
jgi:hypothetical protein